jgi:hypothetical protein
VPTLDDVYRKFGETAEAAQILETELGTILLEVRGTDEELHTKPDPTRASELYRTINRHTLGQLVKTLNNRTQPVDGLEQLLSKALRSRNRLFHSFYLKHNLRRNSDEGRARMLKDLESIHAALLDAYKAVLLLNGIDLDALADELTDAALPTGHLPI